MSKKEVMPAKQLGGVFPNEETFQRIYEECLENEPAAPEAVVSSYREMHGMFEEYLAAVQENMFRYAYRCGYEAAVAAFTEGGAA